MRFIIFYLLSFSLATQAQDTLQSKYIKTPSGFLMVLHQGDSLVPYLQSLTQREKIPSATLSGMGFVNAIFGFYNKETRKYDPRTFNDVELASMNGSIAWQEGKPSLHLHGVVTDSTFNAYGGHLLGAIVGTGSLEITVTVHSKKLQRKIDHTIGANVLQLK